MQRRLLVVALAGCFAGGSFAESPPTSPIALDEARQAPPAVPLVDAWRADADPADYWVSEKLDGVRAIWDGRDLRFRSGRRVPAPAWFLAGLPAQPLDGELWLERGRFDELSGIVRKTKPVDAEWRRVVYMVFELPGGAGSFTERRARMDSVVASAGISWLGVVEQIRVKDRRELAAKLDEVVGSGGEGLVLHRAAAPYAAGRTGDLLKMKPWMDAEATVVGYEPGRGRLAGLTGALRMRTPDGREFRLGSGLSDRFRRHPPELGAIVTYRYQQLTKDGLPRFPRYWRRYEEF
ncbi:MAG TPA: DNA ligase [Rhodocyclaceae bacterium]